MPRVLALPLALILLHVTTPIAPPPIGKLYTVGGHKMHISCTGHGLPAVILESGAGAFSFDWYFVQPQIAKTNMVCSYDRAGHAWSELGPRPRTARQAAYDLRRLLKSANVPAPYVMVGHSLGGTIVRVFESMYPKDVAGVVLVETAAENNPMFIDGRWVRWFSEAKPREIPPVRDRITPDELTLNDAEKKGYQDFLKFAGPSTIDEPYDRLPPDIQKLRLWAMSQPAANVTDYDPYLDEELVMLFSARIAKGAPLGNKPLVVLARALDTSITKDAEKQREQERVDNEKLLGTLSYNSRVELISNTGHEIHIYRPDVVIDAIRSVVQAVRTGQTLSNR